MSDAAKPEPTPFEKLKAITKQVLSVPKAEIDRRDAAWKEQRRQKRNERTNTDG